VAGDLTGEPDPADAPDDAPSSGGADAHDGRTPSGDPTAPPPGSVRREVASFGWAIRGLRAALASERHLRFHAGATVVVVAVGLALPLSALDRAVLALAVGLVWVAELVNTAVERLVDLVSPGYDPLAGRVKDIAAASVLVAALASAGAGLAVLGPALHAWATG
jgi:diacylglycerol kinase (ATP)